MPRSGFADAVSPAARRRSTMPFQLEGVGEGAVAENEGQGCDFGSRR
jgi:hypothetical protein